MLTKYCTMIAKTRAIPSFELRSFSEGVPCTGTAFWLIPSTRDSARMRRRVTCHLFRQAPSFGHQRFTDGGAKNTRPGVFLTLGPLYCRAVRFKGWRKLTSPSFVARHQEVIRYPQSRLIFD